MTDFFETGMHRSFNKIFIPYISFIKDPFLKLQFSIKWAINNVQGWEKS